MSRSLQRMFWHLNQRRSKRGLPLAFTYGVADVPVVTVELYCKWYGVSR